VLQLENSSKVGDWYLYQKHTEIRIYGCQLSPYKMSKYLPMRIFALEYFRHTINSNEANFLSARKKTEFKMKSQLGPFICNTREAGPEADRILQQINFKNSFMWQYDPHGVINKIRIKFKLGPFIHHPRPDIGCFANKSKWLEKTLMDMDNTIVYV